MKLSDLQKQLKTKEQQDLVALICKLYKNSKQAQNIIDIELCGNAAEEQLAFNCKKKIHTAFFGDRLSLKSAKAVISEFRKSSKNKENVAELMLFYVECGMELTNMYGDIDEAFYDSIETMFADFVRAINSFDSSDYYDRNAARVKKVYDDSDCVGWGFHEEMAQAYYEIVWHVDDE